MEFETKKSKEEPSNARRRQATGIFKNAYRAAVAFSLIVGLALTPSAQAEDRLPTINWSHKSFDSLLSGDTARLDEQQRAQAIIIRDTNQLEGVLSQSSVDSTRGERIRTFLRQLAANISKKSARMVITLSTEQRYLPETIRLPRGYVTEIAFFDPQSGLERHDTSSDYFDPLLGFDGSYPKKSDDGPNMSGICEVISTAHSLVFKLKCVKKDDAINDDGEWKQDFLKGLKVASGSPNVQGATSKHAINMHEKNPSNTCEVRCNSREYWWEQGDSLADFCEGYANRAAKQDCTLSLYADDGAHSVYPYALDGAPGKCAFLAADTARQGHNGKRVPVLPPLTLITVDGSSDSPITGRRFARGQWVDYTPLNELKFKRMSYQCCKRVDDEQ